VTRVESEEFVADLDADAVIICSITDYDPYTPRIGIAMQLIHTRQIRRTNDSIGKYADLELLAQTGRPIIVRQPQTNRIVTIRIERVFDSRQDAVKNAVEKYALTRSGDDSPFGADQFLLEHNYIRFIANEMIREMIAIVKAEQEKEAEGEY
jgi:hypothetical protein